MPSLRIRIILLFVVGTLLLLANNAGWPSYQSFSAIVWEKNDSCELTHSVVSLHGKVVRLRPLLAGSSACQSQNFSLASHHLSVDYGGLNTGGGAHVELWTTINNSPKKIADSFVPLDTKESAQRRQFLRMETEPRFVGRPAWFVLRFAGPTSPDSWFSVRSRLTYFAAPQAIERFAKLLSTPVPQVVLDLLFVLLGLSVVMPLFSRCSAACSGVGYLFAALFVHGRFQPFYNADEWHVLQRFADYGFAAVWMPHNEHFIPFFWFVYYLQTVLFGSHYHLLLFVTFLVHATNACLLAKLLDQLAPPAPHRLLLIRLLALLFAVFPFHAEVLQWGLEQCIAFSTCCCLLALVQAQRFLAQGSIPALGFTLFGAVSAPLFFGNGFALSLLLPMVIAVLFLSGEASNNRQRSLFLRRALGICLGVGVVQASVGLCYLQALRQDLPASVEQHNLQWSDLPHHISPAIDFLYFGTQVGTVLRGTGLFFATDLRQPSTAIFRLQHTLGLASYETTLAFLGLLFAGFVATLVILFGKKQRSQLLSLIVLAEGVMISTFLLPAISRHHLSGYLSALVLRYQYFSSIGLVLLFLPIAWILAAWIRVPASSGVQWIKRTSAISLLALTIVSYLLMSQRSLFMTSTAIHNFSQAGNETRIYLAAQDDWQARRKQLQKLPNESAEEALQAFGNQEPSRPVIYSVLGIDAVEISRLRCWLERAQCPS